MRWIRDLVAILGLVALIGGVLYLQREQRNQDAIIQRAAADVRRLELEVKYRAATNTAELNQRGWPVTIDPAWFTHDCPSNTLLGEDRPWVEIASSEDALLQHPPVRMAVDAAQATFWYNPYQGIVRARVPVMVSDEEATILYNRINGTGLPSIFWEEKISPKDLEQMAAKSPANAPDSAPHAESHSDVGTPMPPTRAPSVIVGRQAKTPGKPKSK